MGEGELQNPGKCTPALKAFGEHLGCAYIGPFAVSHLVRAASASIAFYP